MECQECGCRDFKGGHTTVVASKPAREPFVFQPLPPEEMEKTLVTLIKCKTLVDADMIVADLEGIGISAFVPDQYLMQNVSFNLLGGGFVRVQVSPNDYREAKEFLWEREHEFVREGTDT
ncbi:MAG: hypothetical protein JWN25_1284 [Verrucomicrobiales bacterium]|nr:hypothetical protein [Verrucomicrobiales bacterium]